MNGLRKIVEYWNNISKTQRDIKFDYKILNVVSKRGTAHWTASFLREEKTLVELDGIFLVEFDSKNKCKKFREWWHSKKTILK